MIQELSGQTLSNRGKHYGVARSATSFSERRLEISDGKLRGDMEIKDIATVVALIAGPTIAVLITFWHQRRTERRSAKERLFITLMAHRKSVPPTFDWTNALNLIDVVYADNPEIVALYHRVYDTLMMSPLNMQQYNHQYLELLSAMAMSLGYRSLQQTDIDKFYSPQAHGDQATLNAEVQNEFLRVLKETKTLHIDK
jgi:hypothetical protein